VSHPEDLLEEVGGPGQRVRADVGLRLGDLVEEGIDGLADHVRREIGIDLLEAPGEACCSRWR
jgi:hypothetical protein